LARSLAGAPEGDGEVLEELSWTGSLVWFSEPCSVPWVQDKIEAVNKERGKETGKEKSVLLNNFMKCS
jgi:hypothetical protein